MIRFLLKCLIPESTSNSIVIVSISLRSTTSNHSPFSGKKDMFITHCLIMVKAVRIFTCDYILGVYSAHIQSFHLVFGPVQLEVMNWERCSTHRVRAVSVLLLPWLHWLVSEQFQQDYKGKEWSSTPPHKHSSLLCFVMLCSYATPDGEKNFCVQSRANQTFQKCYIFVYWRIS